MKPIHMYMYNPISYLIEGKPDDLSKALGIESYNYYLSIFLNKLTGHPAKSDYR